VTVEGRFAYRFVMPRSPDICSFEPKTNKAVSFLARLAISSHLRSSTYMDIREGGSEMSTRTVNGVVVVFYLGIYRAC